MARHTPATEGTKRCKECDAEKHVTEFRCDRSMLGGRGSTCKSCANAHGRARYHAEPEFRQRDKERTYAYRERHPETRNFWVSTQFARKYDAPIVDPHLHRLVVLEREDGVCGICGEDVDPFDFHVDHIIPLCEQGEHSYENLQIAHPLCNQRKNRFLKTAFSGA